MSHDLEAPHLWRGGRGADYLGDGRAVSYHDLHVPLAGPLPRDRLNYQCAWKYCLPHLQ